MYDVKLSLNNHYDCTTINEQRSPLTNYKLKYRFGFKYVIRGIAIFKIYFKLNKVPFKLTALTSS